MGIDDKAEARPTRIPRPSPPEAAAVEDARRAAEVLTARLAAQQRRMAQDPVRIVEEVVAQAGRVLDAGLAASQTLFGIPRPDRRDDG